MIGHSLAGAIARVPAAPVGEGAETVFDENRLMKVYMDEEDGPGRGCGSGLRHLPVMKRISFGILL